MDALRRKMGLAEAASRGPGADAAWRLALARAARDQMALALDVVALRDDKVSLAELIDMPADRSLLAVLDDAGGEALGFMAIDPALLSGMTGMLTTGRITPDADTPRRPTRTDAAMVAPLIDAALTALHDALDGHDDAAWAAGWRYASFLDEARPLALLLEDVPFRLLRADVALQRGAAQGQVLLALPLGARARRPAPPEPAPDDGDLAAFQTAFARQVEAVPCRIEAELTRLRLPLARALALSPDDILPLGDASVGRLVLKGVDGRTLAEGKLGQMRGQRAVRLVLPPQGDLPLMPPPAALA